MDTKDAGNAYREALSKMSTEELTAFQSEFCQEVLSPVEQAQRRLLAELAVMYHDRCDAFDAVICTGRRNGEPAPMTTKEVAAVNRNAREVGKELLQSLTDFPNRNQLFREAVFAEGLVRRRERNAIAVRAHR